VTSVGIMASGYQAQAAGPCTDVLREPFDNLAAWTVVATSWTIVAGRTGAAARGDVGSSLRYTIPSGSEADTITIGFAVRFSSLGASGGFVELRSDAGATIHGYIHILASGGTGTFRILNSAGTAIVTGTTGFAAINTWYYVEAQVKLHDTAGSATLRVNGAQQGTTFTGDTKNAGTKTTYDQVRLVGPGGNLDVDDLYISTGSGCSFKGDQTVVDTVLLERFNDFTTAPWGSLVNASIVAARTGNGCQLNGNTAIAKYSIASGNQDATVTIGFAFRVNNITGTRAIMRLDSDSGVTTHTYLQTLTDGSLQLKLGGAAGATLATSATGLVAINTYYYIELQATLSDTVGAVTLRLNGAQVAAATNADTKNGGTKSVYDTVTLLGPASGIASIFDDLYLKTGAGATFKGSINIP